MLPVSVIPENTLTLVSPVPELYAVATQSDPIGLMAVVMPFQKPLIEVDAIPSVEPVVPSYVRHDAESVQLLPSEFLFLQVIFPLPDQSIPDMFCRWTESSMTEM